jgi:YD repeat-containing protein
MTSKNLPLFSFFLLVTQILYSQSGLDIKSFDYSVKETVAFSNSRGSINQNNATGALNYGIPVYTINTGVLTHSIGINYYTNGIKVRQEAGPIGLGWNLNAGGKITRTVRGLPDEYGLEIQYMDPITNILLTKIAGEYPNRTYLSSTPVNNDSDRIKRLGIIEVYKRLGGTGGTSARNNNLIDVNTTSIENIPGVTMWELSNQMKEVDLDVFYSPGLNMFVPQQVENVSTILTDAQPDLYDYSFDGYSGKFYYNPVQKKIVQIPENGLKIIPPSFFPLTNSEPLQHASGWNIVTPDGNTYFFNDVELTTEYPQHNLRSQVNPTTQLPYFVDTVWTGNTQLYENTSMEYLSTWHLTKISSPLNTPERKEIKFIYEGYTIQNNTPSLTFTEFIMPSEIEQSYYSNLEFPERIALDQFLSDLYSGNGTTRNRKITKTSKKLLSSIRWDRNSISIIHGIGRHDIPSERFIEKIHVRESLDDKISIEFKYEYFEGITIDGFTPLPGYQIIEGPRDFRNLKLKKIILKDLNSDHSDQYTFDYNEDRKMLSSKIVNQLTYDYFSASKDAWGFYGSYMNISPGSPGLEGQIYPYDNDINSLTKIHLPYGATETFEYEQNEALINNVNKYVGGIRLKKITTYDSLTNLIEVVNYNYNIPGTNLSSGHLYKIPKKSDFITLTSTQNIAGSYLDFGNAYNLNLFRDYNFIYSYYFSDAIGNLADLNGNHILYSYVTKSTPGNGKVVNRYTTFNDYPDHSAQINEIKYFQTHSNLNTAYPDSYQLLNQITPTGYIPSIYTGWKRGLLLETIIYDTEDKLKQKKSYMYSFEDYPSKEFNTMNIELVSDFSVKAPVVRNGANISLGKHATALVKKYKLITGRALLSKEVTINYSGLDSLQESILYSYNNLNLVTATKKKASNGDTILSTYTYPEDMIILGKDSSGIYQQLVNKNVLSPVIETTITNTTTNKPIRFERTNYKSFGTNKILPGSIDVKFNDEQLQKDRLQYLNYDNHGNVLEVIDPNGIRQVILWSYNFQYPIAIIKGTTFSNVNALIDTAVFGFYSNTRPDLIEQRVNQIRNQLPESFVTTQTFLPLSGNILSKTDPNGKMMYYNYDKNQRLISIVDNDGNILKRFCYSSRGIISDCNLNTNRYDDLAYEEITEFIFPAATEPTTGGVSTPVSGNYYDLSLEVGLFYPDGITLDPSKTYTITYWEHNCYLELNNTSSSVLQIIDDSIIETFENWNKRRVTFKNALPTLMFTYDMDYEEIYFQNMLIYEHPFDIQFNFPGGTELTPSENAPSGGNYYNLELEVGVFNSNNLNLNPSKTYVISYWEYNCHLEISKLLMRRLLKTEVIGKNVRSGLRMQKMDSFLHTIWTMKIYICRML